MVLERFKKVKIKNAVFLIIIVVLLITLGYRDVIPHRLTFLNNSPEQNAGVFADTTKTITIKVSLNFNADIDTSSRVDGRDLALLAFFFGKTESEYASNKFGVNPDLNGDKIIDGNDLVILASHFGLEN